MENTPKPQWIKLVGYTVAIIFIILSLLHAYWALGGTWALDSVLPSEEGNLTPIEYPSKLAIWFVSFLLFLAMLIVLGKMGLWGKRFPRWIFKWGTWGLSIVFFMRSVGDFKDCGFFKEVTTTTFAYLDTWLFTPLCLLISVFCVITAIFEYNHIFKAKCDVKSKS